MRVSKKIFLTILSLVFLFSMSCGSNTDPNSGGGVDDYSTYFGASVNNYASQKDITIKSEGTSSENATAGKIDFSVSGSYSYSVSISKVDKGSSPVDFATSDFEYNQNSKELKLSSAGLTKFETSKAQLTEKTKYEYTITFKFTDSDKETTADVKVNLIKAQVLGKSHILEIMKAIKCSDNEFFYKANAGEIVISSGDTGKYMGLGKIKFSFTTDQNYNDTTPNFNLTGTLDPTDDNKTFNAISPKTIADSIYATSLYGTYFDGVYTGIEYNSTPVISDNKKTATYTLKFTGKLKSGYALGKEISSITTTGLSIRLDANTTTFK